MKVDEPNPISWIFNRLIPVQDFQLAGSIGPSSQEIVNLILGYLFAPSSQPPEQNLPKKISQILKSQLIYVPELAAGPKKILIPLALIFCLLSFILQFSWFTAGLTYCRLSISHWVARKNEYGLFVPNTRYLLGILNLIFIMLPVSETALLILNLKGTSILKSRAMIAGSMCLPLWFSNWVYAWGVSTCVYMGASKMDKGFLGKLVDWKYSAQVFNTLIFGSLVVGLTYEVSTIVFVGYGLVTLLDSHDRTVARFETMATLDDTQTSSFQQNILQELPGLIDLAKSFENWLDKFQFLLFSKSVSFLAFIFLSIPLYYIFFVATQSTKNDYCDVNLKATSLGHTRPWEEKATPYGDSFPASQAPRSSPISTIWKFIFSGESHVTSAAVLAIGHTVVQAIVTIRFIYISKQSADANMLINSLANTDILFNFILAFTGLLPSWLFYKRSQLSHLETFVKPGKHSIQSLIIPDIFDTWSIASPIFSQMRPSLRNFPDIRDVKEVFSPRRGTTETRNSRGFHQIQDKSTS